ncbi:MAG: GNAT family N-acetyltransferase [Helicobacteraceae bacterium]|jgi:putative acetyltransferase|nr:GNAT family N-acetyltransferase [Helicobacteraceae bacterium]
MTRKEALTLRDKRYVLSEVGKNEYDEIINVWEISVRSSHTFLKEKDILFYKKEIYDKWLDSVKLFAIKDEFGKMIGFMGTSDQKIEMLFILPRMQGKGVGKTFVDYALNKLRLTKVDVNEQNQNAVLFYYKMGFALKARSQTDTEGKPYPILHLELQKQAE